MKTPLFQASVVFLHAVASRGGKLAACFLMLGLALLAQTARSTPSYATVAMSDSPLAFWQLTETGDPSTGILSAIDSSGNGFNGIYGATAHNGFNGVLAPQPSSGFLGFTNGQGALQSGLSGPSDTTSLVQVPPLNVSTNVSDTTIVMWINPNNTVPVATGLLFDRTTPGTMIAGFGFGGAQDVAGETDLGYNWNDSGATWGWNSPLYVPLRTWSFTALVVQSNKATIYLDYIDASGNTNILSAVNTAVHIPVSWNSGTLWLGGDPYNGGGNRVFPGTISGAAFYHSALTSDQILAMFAAGLGVQGFPPSITGQPISQNVLSGSAVTIQATGIGGTAPLGFQWRLNGTNINLLPDSANFTGINSNVLQILSATVNDVGSYSLVITNNFGVTVSSNAVLGVQNQFLVGKWLTNNTLADVSGYQPAGTHDGYDIAGTGSFVFTNDVPPSKTGQSLLLFNGDTGIAISNSSSFDASYTNTFDQTINNSFTVGCFAKGWPATWNPFVSKFGESGVGWQLRQFGANGVSPCWTIRGTGQNDDMAARSYNLASDTNHWHFYVGTYDAATRVRDLYVDGVLAATETNNNLYALSPPSHLCIGARDNGGNTFSNYFTGQIYDVRVYNYALNTNQVLNWYGIVPPEIASQPLSIGVFAGTAATFNVTASGTPPLTYQWQLNGTNVNLLPDAANFSGANSNVLTVLAVTTNDVGSYSVTVNSTLGYGSTISSNAALTIVPRTLVGEWFTNGTFSELSQYRAPGTHDAYVVGAGNYWFTNDVPLGESGQSIQFASSWDTGVAISNSATADGLTYSNTFDTSEFSVAFWAEGRGGPWYNGRWDAWVAKDGYNNNGENNGIGWSVGMEAYSQHFYFDMEGIDAGGIAYTLGDGLWGNQILESSPQNLPGDDMWHHYATTYNPSTGVRRMYFDGTLVAEQTHNAPYHLAPDKHLTIGCQEQTTHGFTGFSQSAVFDVRVYNYALSANEILGILPNPVITMQPPQTRNAYVGVTTSLAAKVTTFNKPTTNQWQLNGTNLVDGAYGGATISGSTSTVLTIANVTTNLQGVFHLIISYAGGTTISSNTTVTVLQTAPAPGTNLVGAWLTGASTLADVSGYQPPGTHDGYGVASTGVPSFGYSFTNDPPPGETGLSLAFRGNTALAISNSSDLDAVYTNTFDDNIDTNGMTVMCWAKGLPIGWSPWVSKFGENGLGWQLRVNGDGATPCWTIRGTGGAEDMSSTIGQSDGNWHQYAGTYDPVAGVRNLYVDGVLAATESGQGPLVDSTSSHLTIGGRDAGGNNFGNYFTGEIYGVRIYNTALSEAQVNNLLIPMTVSPPVFNPPLHIGNQLVLSWSTGTLLQATNLFGPWTTNGATSPFTNVISTNPPQMFFRLRNP